MKKFALGLLGLGVIAASVQAGPFRRKATTVACTSGNCPAPTQQQQSGNTSTAQGVAVLIVQTGRFRHFGGNPFAAEGIGMGATPDQALRNCCFFGRRQIADVGYARMSNGMWVACARYH